MQINAMHTQNHRYNTSAKDVIRFNLHAYLCRYLLKVKKTNLRQ